MIQTPRSQLAKRSQPSTELQVSNKRPKRSQSVYKQVILDEDEFTDALERIIRRDFFPDLDAVERELERRERAAQREAEDPGPTPATRRRRDWTGAGWSEAGAAETPAAGSHFGETPSQTPAAAVHKQRTAPTADLNDDDDHDADNSALNDLSLTDFLNTYTSEDNASFAEILNRNNEARRAKYAWAFESEAKATERERENRARRQRLISAVQLAVESSSDGTVKMIEGAEPGRPGERLILEPGQDSIIGDKSSIANAKKRIIAPGPQDPRPQLLIEGGGVEEQTSGQHHQQHDPQASCQLVASTSKHTLDNQPPSSSSSSSSSSSNAPDQDFSSQQAQTKDAGLVETWPFTARNSFMYPPDANLSLTAPRPKALEPKEADRLGLQAPKAISHANTRISHLSESDLASVPPSPTHSHIAAAIAGTPHPSREDDPDEPRVGGYTFVDAMPSPTPEQLGKQGMKQLMTYGKLSSAPVPLGEVKEGPFKIPQTPHREQLALSMARKASKSLAGRHGVNLPTLGKDAAKRLGLTPRDRGSPYGGSMVRASSSPRTEGTPRKDLLSPAAKSLLGKTGPGRSSLSSTRSSGIFDAKDKSKEAKAREAQAKKRLAEARWEPPTPQ